MINCFSCVSKKRNGPTEYDSRMLMLRHCPREVCSRHGIDHVPANRFPPPANYANIYCSLKLLHLFDIMQFSLPYYKLDLYKKIIFLS